jgi:hypothetical protein
VTDAERILRVTRGGVTLGSLLANQGHPDPLLRRRNATSCRYERFFGLRTSCGPGGHTFESCRISTMSTPPLSAAVPMAGLQCRLDDLARLPPKGFAQGIPTCTRLEHEGCRRGAQVVEAPSWAHTATSRRPITQPSATSSLSIKPCGTRCARGTCSDLHSWETLPSGARPRLAARWLHSDSCWRPRSYVSA